LSKFGNIVRRGKVGCPFTFRKWLKRDSSVAENIMSRDLEISAEMDTETLRGWVEEIKENPNLLKSLIREHLSDLSAAFFHNRAGNNGWNRSLSHARRCCCWMLRFWGAMILLSGTIEGTAFLQLSEVGAASIIAQ